MAIIYRLSHGTSLYLDLLLICSYSSPLGEIPSNTQQLYQFLLMTYLDVSILCCIEILCSTQEIKEATIKSSIKSSVEHPYLWTIHLKLSWKMRMVAWSCTTSIADHNFPYLEDLFQVDNVWHNILKSVTKNISQEQCFANNFV